MDLKSHYRYDIYRCCHESHSNVPLQIASQELCPTHTETPILRLVLAARDNQVRLLEPAVRREAISEGRVQVLLVLCISALLEDLNEDQVVCSVEAEIRVLADDVALLVLCDDLF